MQIKAPKGTKDILPADSDRWQQTESLMRDTAHLYGYSEVRTPVFENTELFARGVGDTTDIVQKEMYTFKDKGDRSITLKPEGTAGAVRAFLEANLYANTLPCKLYYLNAPIFRYEAPQSGRLREHHQFGIECFGAPKASADAEVISMGFRILTSLGMQNVKVRINSIGCQNCRPEYYKTLKAYLAERKDQLCEDCKTRMDRNPLRVLDCKNESCQKAVANAPSPLDMLCDDCKTHFEELQKYLNISEIPFVIDSHIVRGLDYYTKTVFEFVQDTGNGLITVCGGGRYDVLIKELGGPDTPAVGFGMGIERVLMLISEDENRRYPSSPDVFIAVIGKENNLEAFKILQELRKNSIKCDMDHVARSLKAQFKLANKLKTKYVALVGGDELERGVIKLRNMENHDEQEIQIKEIVNELKVILNREG